MLLCPCGAKVNREAQITHYLQCVQFLLTLQISFINYGSEKEIKNYEKLPISLFICTLSVFAFFHHPSATIPSLSPSWLSEATRYLTQFMSRFRWPISLCLVVLCTSTSSFQFRTYCILSFPLHTWLTLHEIRLSDVDIPMSERCGWRGFRYSFT